MRKPPGAIHIEQPEMIPVTPSVIEYLCRNMRQDEIDQYLALTGAEEYDPCVAAVGFLNQGGVRFAGADEDGKPYCAGGWFPTGVGGVWQSWMVGTQAGWDTRWRGPSPARRPAASSSTPGMNLGPRPCQIPFTNTRRGHMGVVRAKGIIGGE